MSKTAIGADIPPSPEEMIEAIEKMTWEEVLLFVAKLNKLINKKREEEKSG